MLIIIGLDSFNGSYACFMYSILPLLVQSLLKCFRSSHACHMCSVVFLPVYSLFEMFQKISCLPYMFDSVLACVQSLLMHMFQKLSYLLCGLCLSLSSLTLPQTVRLFNNSLHSQAPQQQYTVLSFSLMRRHGHSHKLTSSRALRYCTVGIPFSDA